MSFLFEGLCFLTFSFLFILQTPAPEVLIKKLEDLGKNATSDGDDLTTTTQLPMPADDNVRSVKKSMAVPVPEHRGSGKKDLDMTSQDSSGSVVKAKKGVFYTYNFYYYTGRFVS